jgi:phosphate transport system permease protein
MNKRKIKEKIFIAISTASALLASSLLILILATIIIKALPALSLAFILTTEHDSGGFNGGIANAIVGTLVLALSSLLIAAPLSVCVAIYMAEYAKENIFTKTVRFLIDLLAGTPSIVLGVVGFIILVVTLKYITNGFSLIAGAIILAILILPTITRSAEEALKRVPGDIKEASYAMGSTKWDMIKHISLPSAMPGIITGFVLGMGRAAEESAIVVITAGYSQYMIRFGVGAVNSNQNIFNDIFGDFYRNNFSMMMDFFRNTLHTPVFDIGNFFINMISSGGCMYGPIIKLVPFQEGIATLPITVYHGYEFQKMVPIENAFASATVLIVIVMALNLIARQIGKRYGAM